MPFAIQQVRQRRGGVGGGVKADNAATALLTAIQVPLRVKAQSVGVKRFVKIHRHFVGFGVVAQDFRRGDMGEKQGLTIPNRPFGSAFVRACDQFKIPGHTACTSVAGTRSLARMATSGPEIRPKRGESLFTLDLSCN